MVSLFIWRLWWSIIISEACYFLYVEFFCGHTCKWRILLRVISSRLSGLGSFFHNESQECHLTWWFLIMPLHCSPPFYWLSSLGFLCHQQESHFPVLAFNLAINVSSGEIFLNPDAYSNIPLATSFRPWREALCELSKGAVDGVFIVVAWKPLLNAVTESFLRLSKALSCWVTVFMFLCLNTDLSLPTSVLCFSLFKIICTRLLVIFL